MIDDKTLRKLRSIGVECFITCFNDFKSDIDVNQLAYKLESERKYTFQSCRTRINKSKSIINNKNELINALNYIISAPRVEKSIKKQAEVILKNEQT